MFHPPEMQIITPYHLSTLSQKQHTKLSRRAIKNGSRSELGKRGKQLSCKLQKPSTVNFLSKATLNGFGIVDGNMKNECPDCRSLPGDLPPEKMIIQDLKNRNWNNLEARFGVGAGTLFSLLDNTVLIPDHHEWTTHLGNQLKKSKDVVWATMFEEWCNQCLMDEKATEFIESIVNSMNG